MNTLHIHCSQVDNLFFCRSANYNKKRAQIKEEKNEIRKSATFNHTLN